jgi:hypothetical protein
VDGQLTHYEILGVLTDASADDVDLAYEDKAAVLAPELLSGAPPKVMAAADQARSAIELAHQTLTDPVARERYDIEIGIEVPGSGLSRPYEPPSAVDPHPDTPWHVHVPDIRGLFAGPARTLIMASDLHVEFVQLTEHPRPVEGLVVDQTPPPGHKAHPRSTITMHVWHPSEQLEQRA